jgi:hypothetical protein
MRVDIGNDLMTRVLLGGLVSTVLMLGGCALEDGEEWAPEVGDEADIAGSPEALVGAPQYDGVAEEESTVEVLAGTCSSGSVCMWEDPGYNGSKYVDQPGHVGSYQIDGWDGDNEISAVMNKTGRCVRLYDNDNWTGTSYFIEKDGSRSNLEQNGYDNEAESYRIFDC